MRGWHGVPRFGAPEPGAPCTVRPSAYALIADAAGAVALVRAPDGTYLPGGGIDAGETPEQALAREALEECGWRIRVSACVRRAVQFAYAPAERAWHEKRCWFFAAAIERAGVRAPDPGHETLWVPPARAGEFLSHESQVWALQAWRAGRV